MCSSFLRMTEMAIHIITGHLGSGKTEVAVNLALHFHKKLRHSGSPSRVALLDLDVINPYFAAREIRSLLESRKISVAAPTISTITADIPVLSGDIYRALHQEHQVVIIDVGGDAAGAKMLRGLHQHFHGKRVHTYCVINTKRPYTSDTQGIQTYIQEIGNASQIPLTGLIHNTHLLHETSLHDIYTGQTLVEEVAREHHLPVRFTAVMNTLAQRMNTTFTNKVLTMERYIKPPYEH